MAIYYHWITPMVLRKSESQSSDAQICLEQESQQMQSIKIHSHVLRNSLPIICRLCLANWWRTIMEWDECTNHVRLTMNALGGLELNDIFLSNLQKKEVQREPAALQTTQSHYHHGHSDVTHSSTLQMIHFWMKLHRAAILDARIIFVRKGHSQIIAVLVRFKQ